MIEYSGVLATSRQLLPVNGWCRLTAQGTSYWRVEDQATFVSGTFAGDLTVTGALTPSAGIVGGTNGNTVAPGHVGQTVTWTIPPSSFSGFTTEADWPNATITLTAGVWVVYANIWAMYVINSNTVSDRGAVFIKITDSSNSVVANMYKGIPSIQTASSSSGQAFSSGVLACAFSVAVASSTTYKIRGLANITQGSGTAILRNESGYYSEFFAVRIA